MKTILSALLTLALAVSCMNRYNKQISEDTELKKVIDSTNASIQQFTKKGQVRAEIRSMYENGKLIYQYEINLSTGDTTWIKKPK